MLRSYEAFLTNKWTVKTQYVPYYLNWVSDCYDFSNEPQSSRLSSEKKKQFLLNMAKRHEDWRAKRTAMALRPYDLGVKSPLDK